MLKQLELRNIAAPSKVPVEPFYKRFSTGKTYEIDLLVEQEVVVELKAVALMHPVFEAQLLSFMKRTSNRIGLLVNYNVNALKDGYKRLVLNF